MNTPITPTRDELCDFIYYRHKDAYGVKGRMFDFDSMSYEDLESLAIRIDEAAKEQYALERKCDADAIRSFRASVRKIREICSCDRDAAIRYLLDGEGVAGEYDAGYVCYLMRLPYSMQKFIEPRLRELNEQMMEAA